MRTQHQTHCSHKPWMTWTRLSGAMTYRKHGVPIPDWVPCDECAHHCPNSIPLQEDTLWFLLETSRCSSFGSTTGCFHAASFMGRPVTGAHDRTHIPGDSLSNTRGPFTTTSSSSSTPKFWSTNLQSVWRPLFGRQILLGETNIVRRNLLSYDGYWVPIGPLCQLLYEYQRNWFLQPAERELLRGNT